MSRASSVASQGWPTRALVPPGSLTRDQRKEEALDFYFSFRRQEKCPTCGKTCQICGHRENDYLKDVLVGDREYASKSSEVPETRESSAWTFPGDFDLTQIAHATNDRHPDLLKAWRTLKPLDNRSKEFHEKVNKRMRAAFERYIGGKAGIRGTWQQLQLLIRAVDHDLNYRCHETEQEGKNYTQKLFGTLLTIMLVVLGFPSDLNRNPLPARFTDPLTDVMVNDRSATTILDVLEKLLEWVPARSSYRTEKAPEIVRCRDHLRTIVGDSRFYRTFKEVFTSFLHRS
jgi:hypothetical protein